MTHPVYNIIRKYSPNWNERQNGAVPRFIILHYTGTKTAEAALARYLDPAPTEDNAGPISPHYLIDGNGLVYHLVDEDKRAWHAGVSLWGNLSDMNSHSIGIEIWNEGEAAGFPHFLSVQIETVILLCRDIMRRWSIPPAHVLGHADVSPGRKIDPGPNFPWDRLVAAGVAVRPQISV